MTAYCFLLRELTPLVTPIIRSIPLFIRHCPFYPIPKKSNVFYSI